MTPDCLTFLKRVDRFSLSSFATFAFVQNGWTRRWIPVVLRANTPSVTKSNKLTRDELHCTLPHFQTLLFCFFFSPFLIVILSYCHSFVFESFKPRRMSLAFLSPHTVNVLKKTLLPKLLYCWMSQVMIYCRSYVLWNHSQETCVNTSSM